MRNPKRQRDRNAEMTGIKITATTMLTSGVFTGALGVVEPHDLEGLGPTALFAVITLAALGVLVYFVKMQVKEMRDLTSHIAAGNAHLQELCARLNVRKCLLDEPSSKHGR